MLYNLTQSLPGQFEGIIDVCGDKWCQVIYTTY
jgi:hypothetical protein